MKSIDILLFVEHVARELDIACAVKAIIERDSPLSIEIASIRHGIEETLGSYKPRIVALPYCVAIFEGSLDEIVKRWPKAEYVSLSYEQVLGRAQKELNSPKDLFSKEFVLYHAWGDFFAEYLQAHDVPSRHIFTNGNPTYSLYQSPYNAYYGNQRDPLADEFGLDPDKRWVFIPENYGWAFFEDHMVRARIRRGFDPQQAYEYRDFARESLRAVSRWWQRAGGIDSIEVIIRPRPAIPAQQFIDRVCKYAGELPERLHFIKQGTVREWILASDVVISSYSTTLLEASAAHKPIYILAPQPFPELLYAEWYELTDHIQTQDDFIEALIQETLPRNWMAVEQWLGALMISRGDSIANLAKMLIDKGNGEFSTPIPEEIVEDMQRFRMAQLIRNSRQIGWDLFQRGLAMIGIKTQDQSWTGHESDRVTDVDVNQRVARWAEILRDHA